MCGSKATDNNQSTHISLGTTQSHLSNIPVIATANGKVLEAQNIGGFCGTRVLIDHGEGWQSSYCHLNPETLLARRNQTVQSGQVIGTIGISGQTNWPHLSYALLRNGMVFDPFSNRTNLEGCAQKSDTLWSGGINPLYEPAQVTSIGFHVGYIRTNSILSGILKPAEKIRSETPQLSLWTLMMNIQKGDEISLKIVAPDMRIVKQQTIIAGKSRVRYPLFFSASRGKLLWDKGVYRGEITVTRTVNGNKIKVGKFTTVTLL